MRALRLVALWGLLTQAAVAQGGDRELWLDQRFSFAVSPKSYVLLRLSERTQDDASHLFETFFELNVGFHARPWLTLSPGFIHLRFDPFSERSRFENRPQLALQFHTARNRWRPNVRATMEGRFPENGPAFVRFLLRPGVEYDASALRGRPLVVWLSNEFAFDSRTDSYSRNRWQAGISLPVRQSFSLLPYYLIETNRLPQRSDHDHIFGMSLWWRL